MKSLILFTLYFLVALVFSQDPCNPIIIGNNIWYLGQIESRGPFTVTDPVFNYKFQFKICSALPFACANSQGSTSACGTSGTAEICQTWAASGQSQSACCGKYVQRQVKAQEYRVGNDEGITLIYDGGDIDSVGVARSSKINIICDWSVNGDPYNITVVAASPPRSVYEFTMRHIIGCKGTIGPTAPSTTPTPQSAPSLPPASLNGNYTFIPWNGSPKLKYDGRAKATWYPGGQTRNYGSAVTGLLYPGDRITFLITRLDTSDPMYIGVEDPSSPVDGPDSIPGSSASGVSYNTNGAFFSHGFGNPTPPAVNVGDYVTIERTSTSLIFYINGEWIGNFKAISTNNYMPAVSMVSGQGVVIEDNLA